jgi:hypothetical protein
MALSILDSFQESGQYDDYKAEDGFTDEQYELMLAHLRRMANDQTASMNAVITEQNSEAENQREIRVKVAAQSGQLYLYPEGYGEFGAADGFGSPVFLDVWDGELRVILTTDINSQDQQIISIEAAREERRED